MITITDIVMNITCLIPPSQGLDQKMCLSSNGNYPQYYFIIDCNSTPETRAVFLDISKASDKVWHKGLLFKLESMGLSNNLLNLMGSVLSERFQ